MNLNNPPEIADGGYWYVLESVPDPDEGGQTPGEIPGTGWCAWYANGLVVIRCPEPVDGMDTRPELAAQILDAAGYRVRPRGRVRGN